jgi:hypothetical protein
MASTDSAGQMALTDAIIFMVIMTVCCAVVLSSSGWGNEGLAERRALHQYTEDFAETLLSAELAGVRYTDASTEEVCLNSSRSVAGLLLEELVLASGGCPCSGFTQGYEARITEIGRGISRPGTGFALVCEGDWDDSLLFLSDSIGADGNLPADRCASQHHYCLAEGNALITVYVWVIG